MKVLNEYMRNRLLRVIKKKERMTDRQLFQSVVDIAFDSDDKKERIMATRLISELLMVKESKKTIDAMITEKRVALYLPEIQEPKVEIPSA